jgi:hypothetical protein
MKLPVLIFFVAIAYNGKSQQAVVASGASGSGSGGTISYSVGQIDFIAPDNNTNAGVQQAFSTASFPVTWLSFTATRQDRIVFLKWQTSTEINSGYFIAERSVNGIDFLTEVGNVPAKGNSFVVANYSLKDKNPQHGINYYRIKQVDKDGKFIYSITIAINFEPDMVISCYPNPALTFIRLDIAATQVTGYRYQLFDAGGKLVNASAITGQSTIVQINPLRPGAYVLKVTHKYLSTTFTFIKQ